MSHLDHLHYAFGKPESSAAIRSNPEDFRVTEQLGFDPVGEGQHVLLCIEKRACNTEDVARLLARFAGVRQVAVGYAGLKDRNAVTTQWFSVDLAGQTEPDWSHMDSDTVKVIQAVRHHRKLKRGALRANHFQIALRQLTGDNNVLLQRLELVRQRGVPNYFGAQRFGRHDANLAQARKLPVDATGAARKQRVSRHRRGIYLSALRAFLFNQVASQRVADNTWDRPMDGDVFMLDGSHSIFSSESVDHELIRRARSGDIHSTGPLWGKGNCPASGEAATLEHIVLLPYSVDCAILENAGLTQARRPLRLPVTALQWDMQEEVVWLDFQLPAGSYATSVLRELILSL